MRSRALAFAFCAAFTLSIGTACSDDDDPGPAAPGTGGKGGGSGGSSAGTGGKGGTGGTSTGGKGGTGGTGGVSTGGTGGVSTGGTGGVGGEGGIGGQAGATGTGGTGGGTGGTGGDAGAAGAAGAPPTGPTGPTLINEIESNDTTPGPDWVELYNATGQAIDISGWLIRDDDDTNTPYTFPSSTTLAAGAFIVVDTLGSGLGGADTVRLFDSASNLIDSHMWTAHAVATTYGRCPDGTGAFVTTTAVTKGTANTCP